MWVAVTAEDIVKRWRPLTPAESSVVDAIIEDAQDIVESEAEDLGIPAPTDANDRRLRMYTRIVATMAIRVLINPEGILSETIDDYTYRRDSAISSGALYVSDDEMAQLRPITGRRRRGAFTIVPS